MSYFQKFIPNLQPKNEKKFCKDAYMSAKKSFVDTLNMTLFFSSIKASAMRLYSLI
jgi:hypothetical protein